MKLMPHQRDVIEHLDSGKILWGGVGSGKSATVLAYYTEQEMGQDIYVITTAKKRDSLDWEKEAAKFGISRIRDYTQPHYGTITVDSWNNIGKYVDVTDSFFIFDEQRVVGSGAWTKSFLKIAKNNRWILLSATPGDKWMDYIPVFVANEYYRNATHFKREHVVFAPYVKYPIVQRYVNTKKLERLRDEILVEMPYPRHTTRVVNWLDVGYDAEKFGIVWKGRWHVYEDRPVKDATELLYVMRRVVNSDPSRIDVIRELMQVHPKLIIFYTFNYELDILRTLSNEIEVGEWNGHRKTPIPDADRWVYLVQYSSGAEGWNCVETNAMVFYSLTYSYKAFHQSQGRIDRLNTKYSTLYYYVLASNSAIDKGIKNALTTKKSFNERAFTTKTLGFEEWLL